MNQDMPTHAQEDLLSFYFLGFLVVVSASLSAFVYTYKSYLTFFLLFGCVVGVIRLVKSSYSAGFYSGQQSKHRGALRKKRRNRATEKIQRLNQNPLRLVVDNTRRVR